LGQFEQGFASAGWVWRRWVWPYSSNLWLLPNGRGEFLRAGACRFGVSMCVLTVPTDGKGMEKIKKQVEPLVLTPEEVAEMLSVSKFTIYRLIEQGDIPSVCIGRLRRVRKVDLEHWIEEHLSTAS